MKKPLPISLLVFFLVICFASPARTEGKDKIAVHFEKSFQHEKRGQMTPALNEVRKILAIVPNHYTATVRAGRLSYGQRRYKESIAHYRKAISLAPEAIEPQLGLMLPLMGSHRWKEAEDVATKILERDPMNYFANSRLAFILFSRNKYDQALKQYNMVLKLYPSDTEMKRGLGWTYYRKGGSNRRTAQQWFAEVLNVKPTNASARQGMNLVRMGNHSAVNGMLIASAEDMPEQESYNECMCCWNPAEYMDHSWIAVEMRYAKDQYNYRGLSPALCRNLGGTPCGGGSDCTESGKE